MAGLSAPTHLTAFTNTRLVTKEELDSDEAYFSGTVVRLFHSPDSHPAVRQTLQGLVQRWVGLRAPAGRIAATVSDRPSEMFWV